MKNYSNVIIENAIKNNKLSHAYLFYGDKGVDVEYVSFLAIQEIIASHGRDVSIDFLKESKYLDLKLVEPNENNLITKESVDLAITELFESSLEKASLKFLYIKKINLGNRSSLNRLLKFIEDPVKNLIIIMSTNHFDQVLSTIKSRTQNIYIKREKLSEKINLLKSIKHEHYVLLAHIYSNLEQVKSIDLDLFSKTYNDIIEALILSLKNKFLLKEKLINIWHKNNNEFVINILQFFFYQIMIKIDSKYPIFPNQSSLINQYKSKNLNCFLIETEIEKLKKQINNYANFNLQKINFLNFLEQEMK